MEETTSLFFLLSAKTNARSEGGCLQWMAQTEKKETPTNRDPEEIPKHEETRKHRHTTLKEKTRVYKTNLVFLAFLVPGVPSRTLAFCCFSMLFVFPPLCVYVAMSHCVCVFLV